MPSTPSSSSSITAFSGARRIATGSRTDVALAVKRTIEQNPAAVVLVFDDETSQPVEFDLRGSNDDVLRRLSAADTHAEHGHEPAPEPADESPRGRGRPKLGVVAREVTLLPRHWEWLNAQPGGASVALRKLVETARLSGDDKARVRRVQESVYRFITAMAGNLPGYEDVTRALFANDRPAFDALIATWPDDIRDHAGRLAQSAFAAVA
ncbi:DUF2239 family protein [Paraburkholderia sp.]|uniref:DUF2239 family protein n=1 Tax=Paraburkholderia sp. TaxID=1926495 RepID=UPI00238BDB6D|nr:DUF2239 family protein [Paraburkholderia sp.]MDE1181520.1 DUF2239 family protein [Paraburkholderia sp.]